VNKCTEIARICLDDCLTLAENSESKVYFYKLTADYYRYAAESITNKIVTKTEHQENQNKEFEDKAKKYYLLGMNMACADLSPCNPIRLGVTLNLAVFFKEING
jgi:14-3-3 protein epsilon